MITKQMVLQSARNGTLLVKDMVSDDLSQVIAIENNAQASPWSRLSFEQALTRTDRCRVIALDVGLPGSCNVSSINDGEVFPQQIIAYYVASEVLDELHILNVVVAPQNQGLGLGHMLMDDTLKYAQMQNLKKLFLEVRASNEAAKGLYLKWQFQQIAVRKNYYRPSPEDGMREDAHVFLRQL